MFVVDGGQYSLQSATVFEDKYKVKVVDGVEKSREPVPYDDPGKDIDGDWSITGHGVTATIDNNICTLSNINDGARIEIQKGHGGVVSISLEVEQL